MHMYTHRLFKVKQRVDKHQHSKKLSYMYTRNLQLILGWHSTSTKLSRQLKNRKSQNIQG